MAKRSLYWNCWTWNYRDWQKCAGVGGITGLATAGSIAGNITSTGHVVSYDEWCRSFKMGWCYGFEFSDDWKFIIAKTLTLTTSNSPCVTFTK